MRGSVPDICLAAFRLLSTFDSQLSRGRRPGRLSTFQLLRAARISEISDFLERCRADVYAAVAGVPETRIEQPPANGGWSAAQLLEHLALAESKTSQYLRARLDKAIAAGLPHESDDTSVLGALTPDALPSVPLAAPEAVIPAAAVSAATALAELHASHDELLATLRAADGWALTQVSAGHPILGRLNMYQALLAIGYHDRRHTAQITRVLASA